MNVTAVSLHATEPIERIPFGTLKRSQLFKHEDSLTPFIATGGLEAFPQWSTLAAGMGGDMCLMVEAEAIFAECAANDDGEAALCRPRYYGGEVLFTKDESQPSPHASPNRASSPNSSRPRRLSQTAARDRASGTVSNTACEACDGTDTLLATTTTSPHGIVISDPLYPDSPAADNRGGSAFSHTRRREMGIPAALEEGLPLYNTVGGIDVFDDDEFLLKHLLNLKVAALRAKKQQQQLAAQRQRMRGGRRRSPHFKDYLTPVRNREGSQCSQSVSADDLSTVGSSNTQSGQMMTRQDSATAPTLPLDAENEYANASISAVSVGARRDGRLPVLSLYNSRRALLERAAALQVQGGAMACLDCEEEPKRSNHTRQPSTNSPSSDLHAIDSLTEETGATDPGHSCRSTGDADSLRALSAPAAVLTPPATSLLTPEATRIFDAIVAESGHLCVKSPISQCNPLVEALELNKLLFSPTSTRGTFHLSQRVARHGGPLQSTLLELTAGDEDRCSYGYQRHRPFAPTVGRDRGVGGGVGDDDGSMYPSALPRDLPVTTPVASPLLLKPGNYFAMLVLSEKGSGTRARANVKGSHTWYMLLSGKKRWLLVHPLDKQLVTDLKTGEVANLLCLDERRFPHARHARLYEVTQSAGEALFIPCDAIHTDVTLEPSVSVKVSFMDASNNLACMKYTRAMSILQNPHSAESLLPVMSHLTTVDLVLFDDNVYPSFRGNDRPYRPTDKQSVLVLRSVTEFSQIHMPCSELGARVELEALQSCFSFLGEAMLNEYDPPRYVVGVPKGYLASEADHRLLLYYYVEPFSLKQIRECLSQHHMQTRQHKHFQTFDCPNVTLPAVNLFRSTVSHHGRIPNYVPLSVLFNQIWPFERDLCRKMVSLPRIILEKATHPLGFIRTGSVWHYSRYRINGEPAITSSVCDQMTVPLSKTVHQLGNGPTRDSRVTRGTNPPPLDGSGGETDSSSQGSKTPPAYVDPYAVEEPYSPEEQPGNGWCRTFLFYCSPLLYKPVALHPIRSNKTLQDPNDVIANCLPPPLLEEPHGAGPHKARPAGGLVAKNSNSAASAPVFSPSVIEFEWNPDHLAEYGMVSLLEFEANALAEIKCKILTDPSFGRFEAFVENHCMRAIDHSEEMNIEKVMSVVLWFMCRPCVVGYTIGSAREVVDFEPLGGRTQSNCTAHEHLSHPHSHTRDAVSNEDFPGSFTSDCDGTTPLRPLLSARCNASNTPSTLPTSPMADAASSGGQPPSVTRWDTVALTATAASAFLRYVRRSRYSHVATRLCNWLCCLPEEEHPDRQASLFRMVQRVMISGDAEEQALVYQVIQTKRCNLEKKRLLTAEELRLQCSSAAEGGVPATHCVVDQEAHGFADSDRLDRLEAFCVDVEARRAELVSASATPTEAAASSDAP